MKDKDADEQMVMLEATLRYSGMDFYCEIGANTFGNERKSRERSRAGFGGSGYPVALKARVKGSDLWNVESQIEARVAHSDAPKVVTK